MARKAVLRAVGFQYFMVRRVVEIECDSTSVEGSAGARRLQDEGIACGLEKATKKWTNRG
jgi:hypothetical protein